jgi:predicted SprT family Zn-dependent metalloprotease
VQLGEAQDRAVELMHHHHLTGWRVVFDQAKTRAGVCRPAVKEIGLSRALTELHTVEEVEDTILHEIAHALVGSHHGHDAVWKAKARELGCSARRCLPESAPRVPGAWTGTCPAGHTATRHKRPERVMSCRRCTPSFDPTALFDWRYHGRTVPMPAQYVDELMRLAVLPRPAGDRVAGVAAQVQTAALPGELALPPARLPVGANVVLAGRGRYCGLPGVVVKVGRTRYHVRTAIGLVTAPFVLVRDDRR